ncbi:MAG TPA: DUF1572 family protein [Gemmatimonadaceae bacterium]|jgi:uncharacterized damage-inducible protein DinB
MQEPNPAIAECFVERSRYFLNNEYLPKIRLAIEPLSEEAIWWRGNESCNAIGNLMLHLAGNIRQWIVSGVGGAQDVRQRSTEFRARGGKDKAALLAILTDAARDADVVIAALRAEDLLQDRLIQGRSVTIFEAVYHVVEHFSTHTGQIILLAKLHAGEQVRFYDDADLARPLWKEGTRS